MCVHEGTDEAEDHRQHAQREGGVSRVVAAANPFVALDGEHFVGGVVDTLVVIDIIPHAHIDVSSVVGNNLQPR